MTRDEWWITRLIRMQMRVKARGKVPPTEEAFRAELDSKIALLRSEGLAPEIHLADEQTIYLTAENVIITYFPVPRSWGIWGVGGVHDDCGEPLTRLEER